MKTLIMFLLLTTSALAQNAITGSIEYQQKPEEKFNMITNAYVVEHKQKVSARLSGSYEVYGVNISSITTVNLSDVKDISSLLNFTISLK